MTRIAKALFAAGLVALCGASAAAEEPEVLVELSKNRVYLGESVQYQVTLNHVERPTPPVLGEMADFDVRPLGQQDLSSRRITIINGQRSEIVHHGRAYVWELTPRRAGMLVIPGPTAQVDGRTLEGRAVSIEVIPPDRQDLVRMWITAKPEAVYPTQPLEVTLSVAVKALPGPRAGQDPLSVLPRPPRLLIPWVEDGRLPAGLVPSVSDQRWLRGLANPAGTGFGINNYARDSIFSLFGEEDSLTFEPQPRRVTQRDADGDPAEYWVYDFTRRFVADREGRYRFGPASLAGVFASGASGDQLRGEEVRAVAPAIEVQVKPVPEAERPESYLGAVGRFDWSAKLTPTECHVGDPLTLTLTLSGEGSLAGAMAPELAEIPAVAENFKTYKATRELKGNRCEFTYTLRPLRAGLEEFPPIPASFFDVAAGKYVTVQTEPIPIRVAEADRLAGGAIVGGPRPEHGAGELELYREGIFANATDPSQLADQRVEPLGWIAALGGMAGVYAAAVVLARRYRRLQADPARRRRRTAVGRARAKLSEGTAKLAARQTAEGAQDIRAAIVSLVADAAGVPEGALTPREVCQRLRDCGVDDALVERVGRSLAACEAARYAPSPEGADGLAREADVLFDAMVRSLKLRRRLG